MGKKMDRLEMKQNPLVPPRHRNRASHDRTMNQTTSAVVMVASSGELSQQMVPDQAQLLWHHFLPMDPLGQPECYHNRRLQNAARKVAFGRISSGTLARLEPYLSWSPSELMKVATARRDLR